MHGVIPAQKDKARKQRWRSEEIAIIRQQYPQGGLKACLPLLPHRHEGAIYQKAQTLRLRAPNQPQQRERWTWTQFHDAEIKRFYESPYKGGLQVLARRLARPARSISHRARQLGITPPRFREVPWSEREIEILCGNAAKVPNTIARILRANGFRRTSTAVKVKLTRLHCDRTDDDHYTGRGFAELMGVDSHKVSGWIAKGWLKAKSAGTTREHDIQKISRRDARRFLIENVGAYDIRKVDKFWFVELVAGTSAGC